MSWWQLCLLPVLLFAGNAWGVEDPPPAYKAIAIRHGVPPVVLYSVALQESGTRLRGQLVPWPWTLNVAGTGYRFATRADASTSKPKAKPAPVKATPIPQEPPPFQMVGLEYRGGERFLSVAPTGSTRLSQIYLLRPGEVVSGSTWRLKAVDERTATFDAGGTTRTLSIQP